MKRGQSRHGIESISERLTFPWIWKSIFVLRVWNFRFFEARERRFWETREISRISNYTQTIQTLTQSCDTFQNVRSDNRASRSYFEFHFSIQFFLRKKSIYRNELKKNLKKKKTLLRSNQSRRNWSNTRNKSSWITRSAKRAARYSIDTRSLSPSQAINRRSEEERTREGGEGRKFSLWNVEMISRCRSRATDGGCVLKMKLLRWEGRDCSRDGRERKNRKVVLRLSAWCVPRPRTHFRFNDRRRREEARMFRSGSASNFITGSVKTSWTRGRKVCNANEIFVKILAKMHL